MSNIPTQSDAVVRPMADPPVPPPSVRSPLRKLRDDAPGSGGSSTLDVTDRRIIEALVKDGRLSIRTLAQNLHISRANAYARLERLLSSGVIRGFRAEVDPTAIGLATSAFLTINLRQGEWRDVSGRLREIPGIVHIALVGGDFDVIALVRARDNADLRRIVLDEIHGIPGVLSTRTLLVFDESHPDPLWPT
jgi:DNA-binding Lrp family transcriptional regulator